MVIIMNLFVLMVILSPFTAVIPGIYGIYLVYKKKAKVLKNYLTIGLILLFLCLLFSGVINKSIISIGGAFLILTYIGIAILSQKYFISKKRIADALRLLLNLSALTSIIGIVEKILFIIIGKPTHRIFSTYGNPNMTGAWFGNMILIAVFLKYNYNDEAENKKLNFLLALMISSLLLTESTGAFIALLTSIGAYFLVEKNKEIKQCIIMIVTIIFIILAFVFLQKSINSITVIEEVRTSFGSRYDIWFGSIEMFLLKPLLGWGALGTLEHGIEFMYNNGNVIHSHNVWLTFLVSGGILAFSIYIFIKLNIFRDLLRIYKKYDNYVCLLTALNVMVIIQGLVDCSLYAPQLGVLFIAANSILYNISNGRVKESNNEEEKEVESYKKNAVAN